MPVACHLAGPANPIVSGRGRAAAATGATGRRPNRWPRRAGDVLGAQRAGRDADAAPGGEPEPFSGGDRETGLTAGSERRCLMAERNPHVESRAPGRVHAGIGEGMRSELATMAVLSAAASTMVHDLGTRPQIDDEALQQRAHPSRADRPSAGNAPQSSRHRRSSRRHAQVGPEPLRDGGDDGPRVAGEEGAHARPAPPRLPARHDRPRRRAPPDGWR